MWFYEVIFISKVSTKKRKKKHGKLVQVNETDGSVPRQTPLCWKTIDEDTSIRDKDSEELNLMNKGRTTIRFDLIIYSREYSSILRALFIV